VYTVLPVYANIYRWELFNQSCLGICRQYPVTPPPPHHRRQVVLFNTIPHTRRVLAPPPPPYILFYSILFLSDWLAKAACTSNCYTERKETKRGKEKVL
jgi:hypothetical protein